MRKYCLVDEKFKENHAGFKARNDCEIILEVMGYRKISYDIVLKKNNIVSKLQRFMLMVIKVAKIKNSSLVVMHYPQFKHFLIYCIKFLKKLKKCSVILLIHDIDSLRVSDPIKKEEWKVFNESDYLISHNEKMTEYLVKDYKISLNKIVNLDLFDYLIEYKKIDYNKYKENAVVVAGNLDIEKCGYMYKLAEILKKFSLNAYGPNCKQENFSGNYKGSFLPEEIPSILSGKYGLVWDGESLDSCEGDFGKYLKYNNPHKVSLYLVSGLPVIIWSQAALADLIKKENLGIVIDNLYELEEKIMSISEDEYESMLNNVYKFRKKLINGEFLKKAIQEIEKRIKLDNRK